MSHNLVPSATLTKYIALTHMADSTLTPAARSRHSGIPLVHPSSPNVICLSTLTRFPSVG